MVSSLCWFKVLVERGGKFHHLERSRRLRLYGYLDDMWQRASTWATEFTGMATTAFRTHQ